MMLDHQALRRTQRGQSMTEFLAALVVLLPIFLAITYAGRYSDMQQTAVQASRYVAMQQAFIQPGMPYGRLDDQMKARFFVHGGVNAGVLKTSDTAANLSGTAASPLWRDLSGAPLLDGTALASNVTVTHAGATINSSGIKPAAKTFAKLAGKNYEDGTIARIEVTTANRMDLRTDVRAQPLKLAAATAVAGDTLSSAGPVDTTQSVSKTVLSSYVPGAVTTVVSLVVSLLERTGGPEFGCIKPDVVPADRLEGKVGKQSCR